MRQKLLALLPLMLCANLAFGQLPGGDPSTEASYSYILSGQQHGVPKCNVVNGGSGPTNPESWNVVDAVESFTNPCGGSAQVTVFPKPSVSASASSIAPKGPPFPGTGSPVNFTSTSMVLSYDMQVIGPASTTPIEVFFNGRYSLSGANGSYDATHVTAYVSGVHSTFEFDPECSTESCALGVSGTFKGSVYGHAESAGSPGGDLVVSLGAEGYSQNGEQPGLATIDPYFYLDPQEIAAGYTLVFSASVGNAPATAPSSVPEPGTDSLLLAGLGLLTFASLRRNLSRRAARSV